MGRILVLPLVWAKWVDSNSWDSWRDRMEAIDWAERAKITCESVGWLLYEAEDRIVIACHKDVENDKVDNVWVIPRAAILEWCDILEAK